MNHNLSGSLKINNKDVNFNLEKGILKDWGHSIFPVHIFDYNVTILNLGAFY